MLCGEVNAPIRAVCRQLTAQSRDWDAVLGSGVLGGTALRPGVSGAHVCQSLLAAESA